MRFEFSSATRILFGPGVVREVAPAAKEMGDRALVITGRSVERFGTLNAELDAMGIACDLFPVEGEPTVDLVRRAVESARAARCNLVIGFGGGSALDAGKAVAALLANRGDLADYLEVIGRGRKLESPSAPFIAIPTTAGTGTEVTRNAVLASPEHRVKVSLRSPMMLPRLAVVDPELTWELPPVITARTGLDALTQLIEPFVSVRANPMTDALCVEGIERVARSLRRAYSDGRDKEARADMSLWCTVSPHRWEVCFPLRTAPCARLCCRTEWPRTSGPCAPALRKAKPCAATRRLRVFSPASPMPLLKMVSSGLDKSAASWKFRRSVPMGSW